MALKKFNPTTPGQRQLVMVDRSALYKGKPVKSLTEGKISNGGRNNTGRIRTVSRPISWRRSAWPLATRSLPAAMST
jgi:ribosomal protein L2